jgi:hypothetical protein
MRAVAALTAAGLALGGVSYATATGPAFHATPGATAGPAWYDAAFAERVLAAGTGGVRAPAGATLPGGGAVADVPWLDIRPGTPLVAIRTGAGGQTGVAWCTVGFVLVKNGTYGLGTAGHCAASDALGGTADVVAYVHPPVGSGALPGFYAIGRFALVHDNGVGDDFALVSVFPQYASWVDPAVVLWGGPTGPSAATAPAPVVYAGIGATLRFGYATTFSARGGTAFAMYGPAFDGDAGAAVEDKAGGAVGEYTHVVVLDGAPGEILPAQLAGTTLSRILAIATGWTLVTAPSRLAS